MLSTKAMTYESQYCDELTFWIPILFIEQYSVLQLFHPKVDSEAAALKERSLKTAFYGESWILYKVLI